MQFSSYKVNPKHRNCNPTPNCSVWCVPEWTEVQLFSEASQFAIATGQLATSSLWAVRPNGTALVKLGDGVKKDLFIAKFKSDSHNEWHGYPVDPINHADIPPQKLLDHWLGEGVISKRIKSKMIKGKLK